LTGLPPARKDKKQQWRGWPSTGPAWLAILTAQLGRSALMTPLRLAVAALLAMALAGTARAAEDTPPPANQWVLDCGHSKVGGERFCMLVYIYLDPKTPNEFLTFGVVRELGVEAVFLKSKRGFAKSSRVLVRVDEMPARDYPAPQAASKPLGPRVPTDPLATEMARGQSAAIFFKPANGMQRSVKIPLGAFGLLLEEARQEVPVRAAPPSQ
jgi:hypothetical protein